MEVRSETDYVLHHAQKIIAIFAAMRDFSEQLKQLGHQVIYIAIDDADNQHDFAKNLTRLIAQLAITHLEMQAPDELRVNQLFEKFCAALPITSTIVDSEHFITQRDEAAQFFG